MKRNANNAGVFYPNNKHDLIKIIDEYLETSDLQKNYPNIKAIIVPHAGYIYSGQVAGAAYRLLKDNSFNRVFLFGPSHHSMSKLPILSTFTEWDTPIGPISAENLNFEEVEIDDEAHLFEHSIEIQLPFLKRVLDCEFKINPILLNYQIEQFTAQLSTYISDQSLIIVSSDLSHYLPYQEALEMDDLTIRAILTNDRQLLSSIGQACGMGAILTLMKLAEEKNWKIDLIKYQNSGDTAGDKSQVVGYASFVVYE